MPRRTLFLLLAAVKIGVLVAIVAPTVPAFSADGVPSSAPATATAAAAFAPSAEAFDQATATFRRARDGDRTAIAPARAQFTALLQARPDDPLLLAYAGAATAMQAHFLKNTVEFLTYADGAALRQQAVALGLEPRQGDDHVPARQRLFVGDLGEAVVGQAGLALVQLNELRHRRPP